MSVPSVNGSQRPSNWANCKFTPAGTGAAAIPIPGIAQAALNRQVQTLEESGDGDVFDSTVDVVGIKQSFSITTNKPVVLDTIAAGTKGTFYIERWDSTGKGAVGGGGYAYTLNAVYQPGNQTGSQRQAGTGTATFIGFSADGVTNPLAVAAL